MLALALVLALALLLPLLLLAHFFKMPRNSTKKGTKKENQHKFPEQAYENLELSRKIACYKFWSYLNSAGTEGWSTTKVPGSIYNWRESAYLQKNILKSSWPKIGRVGMLSICSLFCHLLSISNLFSTLSLGYVNACSRSAK